MDALWAKSVALFDLFADLVEAHCPELDCISPRDPERRGSHISFRHPHAFELCQALIADGVIGDFRAPDVVRFGLTPLYLGFEDVWEAVRADAGDPRQRPLARPEIRGARESHVKSTCVLIA